jgi:very-short-patch-repair endonuclease
MRRLSHLATLRSARAAENARKLRRDMTDAERRLWYYLRGKRCGGFRFRHQVPLGSYVVDFLCEEIRVVVEVDGGQHAQRAERDQARTAWLRQNGYEVLRFCNDEVKLDIEGVVEALLLKLHARPVAPSPALPQGGGSTSCPQGSRSFPPSSITRSGERVRPFAASGLLARAVRESSVVRAGS